MAENSKDIQKRILEYRAKENISLKEMAKRCNVSLQTICYIENGTQTPGKLTTQKVLNVIGEK